VFSAQPLSNLVADLSVSHVPECAASFLAEQHAKFWFIVFRWRRE
jgi:hypothetical protein